EQSAARHRADLPRLASLVEALPIRGLAGLDPGFAEHAVLEASLRLVSGRHLAQACDVLPRKPTDRRIKRRDMEADGAGIVREGPGCVGVDPSRASARHESVRVPASASATGSPSSSAEGG